MGRPIDFYCFSKDGLRDYSYKAPIVYQSDTAWVGKPVTLIAKLGNIDTTKGNEGHLGDYFGIKVGKPVDTLVSEKSTNQERFRYNFVPAAVGKTVIKGGLFFERQQPVMFEYSFDVYESKN